MRVIPERSPHQNKKSHRVRYVCAVCASWLTPLCAGEETNAIMLLLALHTVHSTFLHEMPSTLQTLQLHQALLHVVNR
jgi:hypothetical protein